MSLEGVVIEKRKVGANTLNTKDGVTAILASIPRAALPEDIVFGNAYKSNTLQFFKDMGFTAAHDREHGIRVHRQLSEFYRLADPGTKLYLYLVDVSAVSMASMFADNGNAQRLINQSDGDIHLFVASVNGLSAIPAMSHQLPTDLLTAIPRAQVFADWCLTKHKPLHVFLEGYHLGNSINGAKDLRDLEENYGNVSVVVGQDLKAGKAMPARAITGIRKTMYGRFADVGSYVGMVSSIAVNNNPGEIRTNDIRDIGKGAWTKPGFSNGRSIVEDAPYLHSLDKKGYLFGITYQPYGGVFFNNGHCCAKEIVDIEGNISISTVMHSRTWNKALRILWNAYMPYIKTKQAVDPNTGKLLKSTLSDMEDYGEGHLGVMISNQEIVDAQIVIDPNSNLLTGDKTLHIQHITLIPYGHIGTIKGQLGFKTNV